MAINFDVAISGTDTTSYITVDEYTTYLEKLPVTDGLSAKDEVTVIQRLLIAATTAVNSLLYEATGDPSVSNQKLEYPRTGQTDRRGNAVASDAIPQSLKDAVCEMANFMKLEGLNSIAHDGWSDNIESVDVGGTMGLNYTMKPKPSKLVPNIVKQLIADITGSYPTVGMTAVRG